jgi:hypothetical protein
MLAVSTDNGGLKRMGSIVALIGLRGWVPMSLGDPMGASGGSGALVDARVFNGGAPVRSQWCLTGMTQWFGGLCCGALR